MGKAIRDKGRAQNGHAASTPSQGGHRRETTCAYGTLPQGMASVPTCPGVHLPGQARPELHRMDRQREQTVAHRLPVAAVVTTSCTIGSALLQRTAHDSFRTAMKTWRRRSALPVPAFTPASSISPVADARYSASAGSGSRRAEWTHYFFRPPAVIMSSTFLVISSLVSMILSTSKPSLGVLLRKIR
jgi:hypothetical protein